MLVQNKKRIMFYMHYDIGNIIDEHIVYQIKAYAELGIEIVFISNSTLAEFELDKVRPLCRKVMLHHNKGFDFTSWRDAILAEGWDFFNAYDQLIITNCTCYGPIFPFEEMFNEMDKRDPDWWGAAERTSSYGFISHVISSFVVFNKKVFESEIFRKFWTTVKSEYKTFWEVIRHGELRLTETLNKKFKYDVYCRLSDTRLLEELGHLETFFTANAGYFCEKTKSPFMKVKAFANMRTNVYSHADEIFAVLKRMDSQYPIELIVNHQYRTSPLSWVRNFPDMLKIIDDVQEKSAVDLHVFILLNDENMLDFYADIYKNSPFPLYVAVSGEINSDTVRNSISAPNVTIKVISENLKDSDWGGILVGLFPELAENNKIILVNNFKSYSKYNDFLNCKVKNHVVNSLLGSFERMSAAAAFLQNKKDVGMLISSLAAEQIFCDMLPQHTVQDKLFLKDYAGNKIAQENSIPTCMTYACYIKSDSMKLLAENKFCDIKNTECAINSQSDRLIAYLLQKFNLKTVFVTSTAELISENAHLRDKSVSLKVSNFKKHFSASIELAGKACINFYHSIFPASFTHKMMYFEEPLKQFLKKLLGKK